MTLSNYAKQIDAVDREIKGSFRTLLFTPDLEIQYENDRRSRRSRDFIMTGQVALFFYDMFLISDWQMTPDVFMASLIARLGIFTPAFFISWLVLCRVPTTMVREGMATCLAVLSVVLPLRVLCMSNSPDLHSYQYGTVLIMLFFSVMQRLRFRYAVTTILSILVIQLVFVRHLPDVTPKVMMTIATFFVTAAVLLLWASYTLEYSERRGYLLEQRSRLLNLHLDQIAKQDALTGLWNRRHLNSVIAQAWAGASGRAHAVSVILFDVDHFKAFNDTYGHLEGDRCLQQVGACVRDAVEHDATATAVRFGGEEFLVFLDGVAAAAAMDVAARIRASIKALAIPHPVHRDGATLTASFGVATGQAPDHAINLIVAAADEALYAAKRAGRDCIRPLAVGADEGTPLTQQTFDMAC